MRIDVIGAGGAFDSLSSAYIINNEILLDCGESIVNKLIEEKK